MSLNKTTLKKMRKDALVEHILKIQKDNETTALFSSDEDTETSSDTLAAAKIFSMRYPDLTELVNKEHERARLCVELQEENEKLKKEIDEWKEVFENYAGGDIGAGCCRDLNPESFADYLRARMKWQDEDEQKLTDKISELEARLEYQAEEIDEWKERLSCYEGTEEDATPDVMYSYLEAKTDEIVELTDEISELEARLEDQAKEKDEEIEKLKEKLTSIQSEIKDVVKEEEKKTNTKNVKGNRKIVATTYYAPTAVFKIPDGVDLEDKSVVEYWGTKYGTLRIKYVGKEEEEKDIEWEYEPEVDWKYGTDEIIDADEWGVEYSDDEEEEEEEEKTPFWEKPIKRDERGNAIFE